VTERDNIYVNVIERHNDDTFGNIKTDGFFVNEVKTNMCISDPSMNREIVDNIFANAINVLNYCPNPNYNQEFKKTGILIGKVQSGKTSNFIALIALAFDNGYNIAVVIGGNTNELLTQNVNRIKTAFNTNVDNLVVLHSKKNYNQITPEQVKNWIRNGTKVIIVTLKSPQVHTGKHMSRVSDLFDDPVLANETTIIIDDEGDQATLNSKVYSKKNAIAKTYKVATDIKSKINRHCFLSITATPQANILIKTSDVLSPDFGALIYPGEGYCGLSTFHGDDEDTYVKEIPEEEVSLLDDINEIPESFYDALARFYVSNAIRKARGDNGVHSMLIHPSQKKIDHNKVKEKADNVLRIWKLYALGGTDEMAYVKDLKPILLSAYNGYKDENVKLREFSYYEKEILNCILKSSDVIIFNSDSADSRSDAENFNTRIYLGGNILERGLTIKGLAITYIIRRAKGYSNVDTTEQRARWFGYKSDYIDICRVWATRAIKKDFAAINDSDEEMWASIERNIKLGKPFKELPRYFELQYDVIHKLKLTRPSVARTEDISYTEWKSQQYYVKGDNAINNFNLLENLRNETEGEIRDYKGINKHYLVKDYPIDDFMDNVLSNLYLDPRDTLNNEVLEKIFNIFLVNNIVDTIDLMWLRIDDYEVRKLNDDGKIQQLFRGRDIKQNENNEFDYYGDRSTCDERPNKIQIQIHYVKARNLADNDYYSPAICMYIPEEFALNIVTRSRRDE
jgi:hypothetical protein